MTRVTRAAFTDAERSAGQRAMIAEGLFSRAMEGVTGGVILAGFALALGATEWQIGLIAAIPFLAQLAHVPAVMFLGLRPNRKRLAVGAGVAARALFLVIALIPFLALPLQPLHALIPLLVAYAVLATFSGAAWQVWARELVPRERLGAYFGKRMMILGGVGLVTLLAAGRFLAWWETRFPARTLEAFGILFAVGGVLGFTSSFLLSRAPALTVAPRRVSDLGASLKRPFHERNYRRVLVFLGSWGFAANFAVPFITVVLLRTLGYAYDVVAALAALSILAHVVGLRSWAPLTDRFGNKPVLGVAATGFVVTMLAWALIPKVPGAFTLAAAGFVHVLLGFATSGLDIASNGLVMKLAPDEDAPAYLASASVVRATCTGVAPLVAGVVATLLAGQAFSVRFAWTHPGGESVVSVLTFAHHDFLFLVSAGVGLYAVHRLLGFEEQGEAPRADVIAAVRREALQVSSIAGLRQFAHVGSYVTEAAYRFEPLKGKPRAKRATPRTTGDARTRR